MEIARITLHYAIATYRDYVARLNWHAQFYSQWTVPNPEAAPLAGRPSYVARTDALDLRAYEVTLQMTAPALHAHDKLHDADLRKSKLLVPLHRWPVHRKWESVSVTWEVGEDGDAKPTPTYAYRHTHEIAPAQHVLTHVCIPGISISDYFRQAIGPYRDWEVHVAVKFTLRGTYVVSSRVADVLEEATLVHTFRFYIRETASSRP
jgi:hypothetical protein